MPHVQTATTVDRTGQLEVQKLLHIDTNTFRGRRAWQKYLYAADCLLVSRIEAKENKKGCCLESEGLSLWHLWKPTVSHRAIPDFPP